ncbi:LysR family transcriptional regulator [Paraglaciecola aquimarina]|uniref:LysR family transcriptional regulator n=1 Tax=Paraglaciecola algarum TaxID=3050085 RepID=A0ABS9D5V3_9ALTE|nr:LysR family transcriptional regulator [Paraglaciecola sp. G1-23]MCF2948064.1 LysR family transcriptional regulator [Paraglaciecola sp. G1-23]
MKQLSLDNLRTFVTVVNEAGYAKAGDVLGKSQPAISLQIKRLEQQLSIRLFNKKGQRQIVNHEGLKLYKTALKMLALNDELFSQFQPTLLKGRIRLGIPSEFATTLLPSIIGEFSKLYPEVSLEVTSALSKNLLSKDNENTFDLTMALVNPNSNPDTEVAGQLLLDDDLVWVGDKSNSYGENTISLVVAPDGCVYRTRIINTLKQQTQAWRISYTNADLSGITAAIKQGLGISALAKSSVPKELDIIQHTSLPPLGRIKICLFTGNTQHPQACAKLAEFIQSKLYQA